METTTESKVREVVGQESFSFSSFDFNSSIGVLSDDDENDDGYIEIAFETSSPPTTKEEEALGHFYEEEYIVDTKLGPAAPGGSTEVSRFQRSNGRRRIVSPAVNRFVDVLLLSFKGSKLPGMGTECGQQSASKSSWELVSSRKASTKARTSGVRKLLVKFRPIKIWSTMASFVKSKSRQLQSPKNNNHITPHNRRADDEDKSTVLEINLDAISTIIEAVSKSIVSRKAKQSESCPGSIQSFPTNHGIPSEKNKIYTRDNSIQAAIAHCKQSFGHKI